MLAEKLHILLVEDNLADVRIVESSLQRQRGLSFAVTHLTTLEKAWDYLQSEAPRPDLILLDLNLPDASGLETFLSLQEATRDLPVVVLSGIGDEHLAVKLVHLGAQDYLIKDHIGTDVLVRAIRYAIERHDLRMALEQAQQSQQQQRESRLIAPFAPMGEHAAITARLYGGASIEEGAPELFDELVERYSQLMDIALEVQAYKTDIDLSEKLLEMSEEMGFLRVGPRDLIRIYQSALQKKVSGTGLVKERAYISESRLMLIELMGHLITFYRSFSLGMHLPSRERSSEPTGYVHGKPE